MKRLYTLTLSIFISLQLFAQKGDNKEGIRSLFTQANLKVHEHYNDSALKTFLLLYKMDQENANVCYFIGQLYLETPCT